MFNALEAVSRPKAKREGNPKSLIVEPSTPNRPKCSTTLGMPRRYLSYLWMTKIATSYNEINHGLVYSATRSSDSKSYAQYQSETNTPIVHGRQDAAHMFHSFFTNFKPSCVEANLRAINLLGLPRVIHPGNPRVYYEQF